MIVNGPLEGAALASGAVSNADGLAVGASPPCGVADKKTVCYSRAYEFMVLVFKNYG